jgi:hypothetical protein
MRQQLPAHTLLIALRQASERLDGGFDGLGHIGMTFVECARSSL